MKIIFLYKPKNINTGDFSYDYWRDASVLDEKVIQHNRSTKSLCCYLEGIQSINVAEWVLDGLKAAEHEESENVGISVNSFVATCTKGEVRIHFELADNNDPNWPVETFTIAEVKAALEGWKKFLEMPESFDSVVEVEL